MKNIRELNIDENRKITLEGRVVEATPIGKPFHIDMRECETGKWSPYNVWEKTREELERKYLLPDEANAIVFGNSLTYILPKIVGDMRIVAVQPYKVREVKEND